MKKITLLIIFLWSQANLAANFLSVEDCLVKSERTVAGTPTFNFLTFLCQNSVAPALPSVSTNGINGTWSPSAIDTAAEGTFAYTFTPNVGEDAVPVVVQVSILPITSATLTSDPSTINQLVCAGNALVPVTYAISSGAGVTFTSNNPGITGEFVNGIYTISGTPDPDNGGFGWNLTVSGLCGTITRSGSFPMMKLSLAMGSEEMTICRNAPLSPWITYYTGASPSNYTMTVTGLPPGLSAVPQDPSLTEIRIVGAPITDGVYNYTLTIQSLNGSCIKTATGTITVVPGSGVSLTSAPATQFQVKCLGEPIIPITYTIVNNGTVTCAPLPEGVTGNLVNNTYTISGTPTASGSFNYVLTVPNVSGTCSVTKTGLITILGEPTTLAVVSGQQYQSICTEVTAPLPVVFHAENATSITLSGSPLLIHSYDPVANNLTIETQSLPLGTYNYTVTASGGSCGNATKSGQINVLNNSSFLWCEETATGLKFKWNTGSLSGNTGYDISYTVNSGSPVTAFVPYIGIGTVYSYPITLNQGEEVVFTMTPTGGNSASSNYCYGPATTTCLFNLLGTDDLETSQTHLFPNPVRDWLTIDSPVAVKKIMVYNVLGQKLKEDSPGQNLSQVDLSALPKGVYLIDVHSDEGIKRERILKE